MRNNMLPHYDLAYLEEMLGYAQHFLSLYETKRVFAERRCPAEFEGMSAKDYKFQVLYYESMYNRILNKIIELKRKWLDYAISFTIECKHYKRIAEERGGDYNGLLVRDYDHQIDYQDREVKRLRCEIAQLTSKLPQK